MEREPYWDYMGKRLREERERNVMKESDLYRRKIKKENLSLRNETQSQHLLINLP